MDTALPQKCPLILDRNLPKANCTGNRVCTSCDTVVLASTIKCSYSSPKLTRDVAAVGQDVVAAGVVTRHGVEERQTVGAVVTEVVSRGLLTALTILRNKQKTL